jgi:hypothetical protein
VVPARLPARAAGRRRRARREQRVRRGHRVVRAGRPVQRREARPARVLALDRRVPAGERDPRPHHHPRLRRDRQLPAEGGAEERAAPPVRHRHADRRTDDRGRGRQSPTSARSTSASTSRG